MNMKLHNIKRSSGILAAGILTAAALLTGCQREFELDLPLAVSARDLTLSKDAGSTHVLVYSTGEWTARFTRNVNWASLNKLSGYGNNEIVFTYSANYGVSRKVGVVFEKGALTDTVMFSQNGSVSAPSIAFSSSSVSLLKAESDILVPLNTNLLYSLQDMEASVIYYDTEGEPVDTVDVITIDGAGSDMQDDDPAHWISGVSISKEGLGFSVSGNSGSMPRLADILVYIKDAQDELTQARLNVTQGIAGPELEFAEEGGQYEGYAQTCTAATSRNNLAPYSDRIGYEIAYNTPSDGNDWLLNPVLTTEGLTFSLTLNNTGASRSAVITLRYEDADGNEVSDSYTVTQTQYPDALDFAAVRALGSGKIDLPGYIEGYVVSDPASKNIISSPQTAQFTFDRTVNDRTVYIESKDAEYGFCLQFASAQDNTLEKYSRVRLSLQGAELTKHDSPEYYTISGLTSANILEASVPDVFKVPIKTKKIDELSDKDIFTLVSIENVEIMCKDGAYTNCTDGYSLQDDHNTIGAAAPRWDVAPLMCYDREGNSIFMLTNAAVTWRRFSSGPDLEFGTVVPQGSGTFRGIVVADEVAPVRFGDLGKYQLRAMTEEDIDLNDTPFTTTIVEWNWNDRKTDLAPETGNGTINIYNASSAGAPDFNNVVCSGKGGQSTEQKGLVANGAIRLNNKWWDFSKDEGKYIDITFSTAGISGQNLFVGLAWGHGQMNNTTLDGPAHWKLLYSTDGGESFNEVPGGILTNRSIVWWGSASSGWTSQDATPGYTEHLRKLPAECFGKDQVVLRLQVADKVTDIDPKANSSNYKTALGIEKGTLTDKDTSIRIGTLTVRYN